MTVDRDLPGPLETRLAYGVALCSTFVWVTAVMPGVALSDPSVEDDLAATLLRGAVYLVPALVLLVAMPVAVVLARQEVALKGLLAGASVFVALYAGAAMLAAHPTGFRVAVVVALALVGGVAARDALRLARTSAEATELPRTGDLRLVLCILALLTPVGLLFRGPDERATWLVPFVFLAVAAGGERFARGLRALRRAAVLCLVTLALHLTVAVRYVLTAAEPAPAGWTPWGVATFGLACALLVGLLLWGGLLGRRGRAAAAVSVGAGA